MHLTDAWEKCESMQQYISYLQTSTVGMDILYNIFVQFGLPMEPERLIMTPLNEPCGE